MNNRMIGAATALALLTGVSGFALAQSQPPATNADNQPPTMSGTTKPMTAQPTPDTTTTAQGGVQTGGPDTTGSDAAAQMTADNQNQGQNQGQSGGAAMDEQRLLIGKAVVDQEGQDVGEIQDILIGQDGKPSQAVIAAGGFLGIGEKEFAVSFDDLEVGTGDGAQVKVKSLKAADIANMESYEQQEGTTSMRGSTMTGAAGAQGNGAADGSMAPQPGLQTDTADGGESTTGMMNGQGMDNNSQGDGVVAEGGTTGASGTNAGAAAGGTGAAGAEQQNQQQTAQSASDVPGAEPGQMRLIGMNVVGSDDKDIGQIDDVLVGQDGKPARIVVSSGGFLGLGEKRFAVPFDQMQVDEQQGRVKLSGMTADQVKETEDYAEDPAYTSTRGQSATGGTQGGAATGGATTGAPAAGGAATGGTTTSQ